MISLGVLQVLLKAKDQLSGPVKKASGRISKFNKSVNVSARTAAAGLAILAAGAVASVRAFDKQVDAINSLNLALMNQGNFTQEASQRLQEFASNLQKTSTFGDEAIIKAQALAATFGMNEEQLKLTTKAAADFAAATGRDLTQSINLLGKAFVGETGELSRYGIIIDQNIPKTEKFDEVIRSMSERFGGSAQLQTATFTGQVKQLGNAFGDTIEQVGKFVTFMGSTFAGGLQVGVTILEGVGRFFGETLPIAVSEARAQFAELLAGVFDVAAGLAEVAVKVPGLELFGDVPDPAMLTEMADGQRRLAEETRQSAEAFIMSSGAASENALALARVGESSAAAAQAYSAAGGAGEAFGVATVALSDVLDIEVAEMGAAWQLLAVTTQASSAATEAAVVKDLSKIKSAHGNNIKSITKAEKKLADFRANNAAANTAISLGMLTSIGSATTQALGALGSSNKKFSLSQAIINTALAVTKALTALPFPFNLPAAAGAAAAGAIQIATIASQPGFQKGTPGLDFQDFGGESIVPVHGKEAIIPQGGGHALAREIAATLSTQGGGGVSGGVTNITIAPTIEMPPGTPESQAEAIEEAVYRLLRDSTRVKTQAKEAVA